MNCIGLVLPIMVGLMPFVAVSSDDYAPIPRRIPPPGIDISDSDRVAIETRLRNLKTAARELGPLPDIEIFLKAVEFALEHNEFYRPKDVQIARDMLEHAATRIVAIQAKETPWTTQRGLIVRGYRSSIDGSAQPYGLEVPEQLDLAKPVPLYVWLHGRGDKTTDLHFIAQRLSRKGRIAPAHAIVLHPFGRQCIGFKSAGEIDVLEAIEHVATQYPIDRSRIVLMGFSMGGAGAWHIGAHYVEHWRAISPGAGFSETALYNRLTPDKYPSSYEQLLWGLYDVPKYARNLLNVPVVAYSGEKDKQIQAARVMEKSFEEHGATLTHVIGPDKGHQYHPDSLKEIMDRMLQAELSSSRRTTSHLQTQTLRYNRAPGIEALGLKQHWQDSRIDVTRRGETLSIQTQNITALRVHGWALEGTQSVSIDSQRLPSLEDGSLYSLTGKKWSSVKSLPPGLKRHGLQGPIDDAFMDRFLVVVPSGLSQHEAVERWVKFEIDHLVSRWASLFRGRIRLKKDTEVSQSDRSDYHLILWGDPQSNRLIKDALGGLPLSWTSETLTIADRSFSSATHVPALIYPSPFDENRYVVLNSGPTFREDHDRTNSLQNPKLPDWAVFDLVQPPTGTVAGKVVAQDFFNEAWEISRPSKN